MWITTGFPSSAASASCRSNSVELAVVRRVVAVEVEPGLADGDGARVREALARARRAARVVAARSVWMDAEDRADAVVPVGELQRGRRPVDGRRDGEDPFDAGLARASDQDVGRVLARVEVRVRVDHAAVEACRIRSSSSSTTLSSSLLKSGGRLAEGLARRERARRPGADPGAVVAGEHDVRLAVLLHLAQLERAGEVAVVAEQLVEHAGS